MNLDPATRAHAHCEDALSCALEILADYGSGLPGEVIERLEQLVLHLEFAVLQTTILKLEA